MCVGKSHGWRAHTGVQISSLEQQLAGTRQQIASSMSATQSVVAPLVAPGIADRVIEAEVEYQDPALLEARMRLAQAEHFGASSLSLPLPLKCRCGLLRESISVRHCACVLALVLVRVACLLVVSSAC